MPVPSIGAHMTSRTLGFGTNVPGIHDPEKHGMVYVSGQVYVREGIYYIRQRETKCEKHHRTGKPSYHVDYVGLDDEFELNHLKTIIKHMEETANDRSPAHQG